MLSRQSVALENKLGGMMNSSLASITSQRLHGAGIAFLIEGGEAIRIPAGNSEVGDIVVSFEGGEISVYLGDITHCHFTPYEADDKSPGCTPDQAAADAAQFIREVMDDLWIIWRYSDGRGGGCYMPEGDDEEEADAPLSGHGVEYFVWSGSLVPNKLDDREE
jgi:hypothetical protein